MDQKDTSGYIDTEELFQSNIAQLHTILDGRSRDFDKRIARLEKRDREAVKAIGEPAKWQDILGTVGHLQDTVLAHAKSLKTMQEEAEFNRRQRQRTQVELDRRQKQIEQLEDRARHLEHMFDGCGMPIPNADLVPLSGAVCWTTFWAKTCQVFHGKLPHLVVDLLIDVGIFPAEVKRRLHREEVRDD